MMWMMAWTLLFWVALAGGGIWLFTNRGGRSRDAAIESLRERLARGEISIEEFRRHREELNDEGRNPRRGALIALVIAVVLAVFLAVPMIVMANGWHMWDMHGRGRNTSGSPIEQGGARETIVIEDFSFVPGNLEVPAGATVTWINRDSAPHDATARDGGWRTERLSRRQSDALTFNERGEYDYYCSIHPSMKARLVVQ